MDTGLRGKVALVTAASRGLGFAAARALAAEGARVVICSRDEERVQAAAERLAHDTGGDVRGVVADVARPGDPARLVAWTVTELAGLDVLVCNAGGPRAGRFDDLAEADWRDAIDLTLLSVVRLCRAAVPHLRARGAGRIVTITSVSVKQPIDGLILSNALRAAVVGFSRTLATELAPQRITVNCVAPGYTRTERVVDLAEATARREGVSPDSVHARLLGEIPAGRYGEPSELAALVAFLCSDRAAYVTGTTIPVDGGFVRGLM